MKKSHKAIVVLSVILLIGYTWSLDMPEALEVPLREQPYSFSNFQYNFLYFATYISITFSDMPVGMLLDKYPLKKTVLCISLISLIAEVMIFLMFHLQCTGYKIIIYIFRGIFGTTGQALFTLQALLISLYGGKYYDRLIGVAICVPLIFDSIGNIATPSIYSATNSMQVVWGIGISFCIIAFIFAIVISTLITRQQKTKQKLSVHLINQSHTTEEQIDAVKQEQLNFNGLKNLSKEFWIIAAAVFFTQYIIGSYIDNLNDTLVKRFRISYVNAGYLMFIPYGIAAFLSLLLGLLLEKKPKLRRTLMIIAAIIYSVGMLAIYFLPNLNQDEEPNPFYYFLIAIQFLTVSFLVAIEHGVLSSSIIYIVDPKNLGIAWGVIGSMIGISEAVGPLIVAWILQSQDTLPDGYKALILFLFCVSLINLAINSWIYFGKFSDIDVTSCDAIQIKAEDIQQQSGHQGHQDTI